MISKTFLELKKRRIKASKKKRFKVKDIKKYLIWRKREKLFKIEIVELFYCRENPSKSYLKPTPRIIHADAKNKKDLFRLLNKEVFSPILSYSYLGFYGNRIKVNVSTIKTISNEYNIVIGRVMPSLEELEEVYKLKNDPMWKDQKIYAYKTKVHFDNIEEMANEY